jgi:hypothetical protein
MVVIIANKEALETHNTQGNPVVALPVPKGKAILKLLREKWWH